MWRSFGRPAAAAVVTGGGDMPCLYGTVRFYPGQGGIFVVADICGLPKTNPTGIFGFHIHAGPTCTGRDFADTGGHYNPANSAHPEHVGDLPPLFSCQGRAYMAVLTNRFRLPEIIGKTVVIHSGPDDFHSQPAGNAGAKIACGRICRVS